MPSSNLRQRLRKIFVVTVLSFIGLAGLSYAGDFLVFRIRLAEDRSPYSSVRVDHYYAVPQKNGKTQFIFDPPQDWRCVHALFPHSGSLPCWYLSRHPEQRTDM